MGYHAKGKLSAVLSIYENKPEGAGTFPTIIIFMHAGAIDDPMKRVADDLATEGYYTICADGYLNGSYNFQTRSDQLIFNVFNLTMNWLDTNPYADLDKLGVIGFCMGGRHAYLSNARSERFKAVVSFYGFPHRGTNETDTPQNLIDKFTAPTLSFFGSEDKGIPVEAVNIYKQASEKLQKGHQTFLYEGAGHGFLDPGSPRHHKEASEDAWKRTVAHFKQYLS